MPKNSSTARREAERALAAAEGISYTAALRRPADGTNRSDANTRTPGKTITSLAQTRQRKNTHLRDSSKRS
jgi:hypothetical protein